MGGDFGSTKGSTPHIERRPNRGLVPDRESVIFDCLEARSMVLVIIKVRDKIRLAKIHRFDFMGIL